MKDLPFITGNQNKADYLAKWLDMPLEHRKLDLDEIQSLDLREVVEHKVRAAYNIAKRPVLVEDVALTFTAMGRLPGTLIRWFLEELGLDGLCDLAGRLENQKALSAMIYAIYDGTTLKIFSGETAGHIASVPRGESFGWNNVFIPEGFSKTYGEMSDTEFNANSHRGQAFRQLKAFLASDLAS